MAAILDFRLPLTWDDILLGVIELPVRKNIGSILSELVLVLLDQQYLDVIVLWRNRHLIRAARESA